MELPGSLTTASGVPTHHPRYALAYTSTRHPASAVARLQSGEQRESSTAAGICTSPAPAQWRPAKAYGEGAAPASSFSGSASGDNAHSPHHSLYKVTGHHAIMLSSSSELAELKLAACAFLRHAPSMRSGKY